MLTKFFGSYDFQLRKDFFRLIGNCKSASSFAPFDVRLRHVANRACRTRPSVLTHQIPLSYLPRANAQSWPVATVIWKEFQ